MMAAWIKLKLQETVLKKRLTEFANELVVGMYVKRKNQGCLLSFCPEQLEEWKVAIYWDEKS